MAGLIGVAQTAEIATGTSKKTLLQIIAAANHRVKIKEISISFDGTSNTAAPILVQVLRQTDTPSSMTSLTPEKFNESDQETLQTTAYHTATSEPTGTSAVLRENVHPQGGYTWQPGFGSELIIEGGNILGIAVTAGADVNAVVRVVFEE